MEKVCCGGFYLGEGLELDGRTLKATGGSSPVPDPEAADIGKVLGIVEDGTGAKYAPVEGSGLPDPSTLTDGTVMVAVNGEWKMQEGYGYTGDPAFEPITWDGNTEGRESPIEDYYKVADEIDVTKLVGAISVWEIEGESVEMTCVSVVEQADNFYNVIYDNDEYNSFVATEDLSVEEMQIPKGVYFISLPEDGIYQKSLTAPSTVHKFDPALIPTSGAEEFVVTFEQEVETLVATADKTYEEIENALMGGKKIKGYLYQASGTMKIFISELNLDSSLNFYSIPLFEANNNLFKLLMLSYNEENWDITDYSYTLTPAT